MLSTQAPTNSARQQTMETLPFDVLVDILSHLQPPDTLHLAATNKRMYDAVTRASTSTSSALALFYRHCSQTRFRIPQTDVPMLQRRFEHDPTEPGWQALYQRLDDGVAAWRGIAMDPVTNTHLAAPGADDPIIAPNITSPAPYTIEVLIHSAKTSILNGILASAVAAEASNAPFLTRVRITELSGMCRFRSLNDALTRIDGMMVDNASTASHRTTSCRSSTSSLGSTDLQDSVDALTDQASIPTRFLIDPVHHTTHILRPVVFEEQSIIRGSNNIAIPNRYYAMTNGFIMIGMFDPSSGCRPDLMGVFCVVLEDAVKMMRYRLPSRISVTHDTNDRYALHRDADSDHGDSITDASLTHDKQKIDNAIREGTWLQGYLCTAVDPSQQRPVYAVRARVTSVTNHTPLSSTPVSSIPNSATSSFVMQNDTLIARVDMWILTDPLPNSCTVRTNIATKLGDLEKHDNNLLQSGSDVGDEDSMLRLNMSHIGPNAQPTHTNEPMSHHHSNVHHNQPHQYGNDADNHNINAGGPWVHISLHGIVDGTRDPTTAKLVLFSATEVQVVSESTNLPTHHHTRDSLTPVSLNSASRYHDRPNISGLSGINTSRGSWYNSTHRMEWIARHIPNGPIRIWMEGDVWISTFADPSMGVFCLF